VIDGINTSGESIFTSGITVRYGFKILLSLKGNDESGDEVDNKSHEDCDGMTKLTSVILVGLTAVVVTIIDGLLLKIRKLKTGTL
ncbi:uncharacterized protein LOC122973288 isoform X3, partial [Scomber scombrus]